MTDYKKEKILHDYLVTHVEYDRENYYNDTIPDESYTPYGALIKGVSVCNGYAQSTKLLFNLAGLNCDVIVGKVYSMRIHDLEGHAWNTVEIDGKYYHIDTTWDDLDRGEDDIRHNYFNLNDIQLRGKSCRIWDNDARICDGFEYNYAYQEYCKSHDIDAANYRALDFTIHFPRPLNEDNDIEIGIKKAGDDNYTEDWMINLKTGDTEKNIKIYVPSNFDNKNYSIDFNSDFRFKDFGFYPRSIRFEDASEPLDINIPYNQTIYGSVTRPKSNYAKSNSETIIVEFLEIYDGENESDYSPYQAKLIFEPGEYQKTYKLPLGRLFNDRYGVMCKYENDFRMNSAAIYYSESGNTKKRSIFDKDFFYEKHNEINFDLDYSSQSEFSGNIDENNLALCKKLLISSIETRTEITDVIKFNISEDDFIILIDEIYREHYDEMQDLTWSFRVGRGIVSSFTLKNK